MDQNELVSGGVEGLKQIAQAFRARGLAVTGIYLILTTSMDDESRWTIRLVTAHYYPDLSRQMIYELVRLRRDKLLPEVSSEVRFDIVDVGSKEASRVLDYARRFDKKIIKNTMWNDVFIEYAVVGEVPDVAPVPA